MKKRLLRLGWLFVILATVTLVNLAKPAIVLGDEMIGTRTSGSGGGCFYTSNGWEEISQNPPVCVGTVSVYAKIGSALSGEPNMCAYGLVGSYNCDSGEFTPKDTPDEYDTIVNSQCIDSASPYNSCQINKWTGGLTSGGLTCGFWDYTLHVSAGLPCATLDIEPYPVTLVRWPTYLRFSGAGSSSASATLDFRGRGTPAHPLPGDRKDIRLTLTIQPYMNYLQVHLPHAGYYQGDGKRCLEVENFSLPLQNSTSPPSTTICWNVPSHPAAGASVLAGGVPGMDEIASDFPLFVGWARAAYTASWRMTYEEWDVVGKNCEPGPAGYEKDGTPIYECRTPGSAWKNGHWVEIYDWKRHSQGGIIDPAVVEGLPASLKADLNGDGRPDAFWGLGVRVRRMNESWQVNDPVYGRSWQCRTILPFAVREGQTQSIYQRP